MNISISELAAILTAIVAVAGLLLSVYNFYTSRRDKQPRLIAKISNGFLTQGPELGSLMLLLEIANSGEKVVKVSAVEIKWKRRKIAFLAGIPGTAIVPFDLHPGDSATFWIPAKEVALSLSKQGHTGREHLQACFRSAIGTEYTSRKFRINVSEWLNLKSS